MKPMVLVLGLPHEPPVRAVIQALTRRSAPCAIVDQRRILTGSWDTWLSDEGANGRIMMDGRTVDLEDIGGVYTRNTSWAELPEIRADPGLLEHALLVHEAMEAWLEITEARVINRTSANDTNNSKPYQSLIIKDTFDVPATLVTNDPEAVESFRDEFGRIIYKSVSGERSIVTEFNESDRHRLKLLASCPVQFQELVRGIEVRVHVVGAQTYATSVVSDAIDYRYNDSGRVDMKAVDLPEDISNRCIALTARLGLELAGIDLCFTHDGRVVCYEVNPSPAYIVYEEVTDQPIADAIARHLCGSTA